LDPRFEKINELFINYSVGNFEHKIELTEQLDEIDAFISSINMLGEELKETTISKNYFNNIFNSVSDMLFVLDESGKIERINKYVTEKIQCSENDLNDKGIDSLIGISNHNSFFSYVKEQLPTMHAVEIEGLFYSGNLPVLCTISFLFTETYEKIGYLLVAKDISNIKKYEASLKRSEEKFRKIFEETSEAIFIISEEGIFKELNKAGLTLFNFSMAEIENKNFFNLFNSSPEKNRFMDQLRKAGSLINFKTKLHNKKNGKMIDCLISANKISSENNNLLGYQGIIKDITKQREMENLVFRTIVDTQETERIRFAKDIHDSLGQQLSAIKFYLATLNNSKDISLSTQKALLTKSNEALTGILADLRNICFNLMPKTLENYGLIEAISELCRKTELSGALDFQLAADEDFPELKKPLKIAIFRIAQEFINNSIKHGKAKKINMTFKSNPNGISIILKDNGIGFDTSKAEIFPGMGLKNVKSRVQSYNGDITVESGFNKGTSYQISIPVKTTNKKINKLINY
jgi:PAS domain S-box-containing protein